MQDSYSVDIRAPAFWRLIANVYSLTESTPSHFVGEIKKDYFPHYGEENEISTVLAPVIYRMNITKEPALSEFPTDDTDLLSKAIVRILLCYMDAPEVHTKINTLHTFERVISMFETESQTTAANLRANELKDLNDNLQNISKKIDRNNINASVDFIQVFGHSFHPDSQFIRFSVETHVKQ